MTKPLQQANQGPRKTSPRALARLLNSPKPQGAAVHHRNQLRTTRYRMPDPMHPPAGLSRCAPLVLLTLIFLPSTAEPLPSGRGASPCSPTASPSSRFHATSAFIERESALRADHQR